MYTVFTGLEKVISGRRTTKPAQMNGGKIPDIEVRNILALADWAPTHGRTEPWRFVVYAGEQVQAFCQQHADLYQANAASFLQATYNNLLHMGDKASHIIIAYMQRGHLPKIPVMEEIAATAVAIQHILLGAEALGIASYWGTGGMALHPAMKEYLQLREEDMVIGIIYLGYTHNKMPAFRAIPLEEKVKWVG